MKAILAMLILILCGGAGGWIARGAWASDRCRAAGGTWLSAFDQCDRPDSALHGVNARLPFVRDAVARWARKDGLSVTKAMEGRTIETVTLPDRQCVSFGLGAFDVGGVPTYCYRPGTTDLVWEESDVE